MEKDQIGNEILGDIECISGYSPVKVHLMLKQNIEIMKQSMPTIELKYTYHKDTHPPEYKPNNTKDIDKLYLGINSAIKSSTSQTKTVIKSHKEYRSEGHKPVLWNYERDITTYKITEKNYETTLLFLCAKAKNKKWYNLGFIDEMGPFLVETIIDERTEMSDWVRTPGPGIE